MSNEEIKAGLESLRNDLESIDARLTKLEDDRLTSSEFGSMLKEKFDSLEEYIDNAIKRAVKVEVDNKWESLTV